MDTYCISIQMYSPIFPISLFPSLSWGLGRDGKWRSLPFRCFRASAMGLGAHNPYAVLGVCLCRGGSILLSRAVAGDSVRHPGGDQGPGIFSRLAMSFADPDITAEDGIRVVLPHFLTLCVISFAGGEDMAHVESQRL